MDGVGCMGCLEILEDNEREEKLRIATSKKSPIDPRDRCDDPYLSSVLCVVCCFEWELKTYLLA